jgi:hypothetical protein
MDLPDYNNKTSSSSVDLNKLTRVKLLEKCEKLGITKCKSKNKGELIELINNNQQHKTQEFIKLYFGNNAINTTELCEILPIYNI